MGDHLDLGAPPSDFSVHRVHQLLDTIERDLADLCQIDLVVEAKQSYYARYGGDSFDDITPWSADETVGRRYPFQISIGNSHEHAAWTKVVKEAGARADGWAREMVAPVRQEIALVIDARPVSVEHAVVDLERVSRDLVTVIPPQLRQVDEGLREWTGRARKSFGTFLADTSTAASNLAWAVEALRTSLAQTSAVMRMGQVALMGVLERIARDLDAQLRKRQDDEEGKQDMIKLVLFAATAAGVLGAVTWPAAASLSASSALLGFVKDVLPQEDARLKEVALVKAGDYARELHDGIKDVVQGTGRRWEAAHGTGADRMRAEANALLENSAGERFEPKMPGVADGPIAPGDFTHPRA